MILDRESQFVVELMKELNEILEIETKLSTAFYPQTNRQIEREKQDTYSDKVITVQSQL